jgi:hypothetical protein
VARGSLDLFAAAENALVPRFFARFPERLAEGVDALAQPDAVQRRTRLGRSHRSRPGRDPGKNGKQCCSAAALKRERMARSRMLGPAGRCGWNFPKAKSARAVPARRVGIGNLRGLVPLTATL